MWRQYSKDMYVRPWKIIFPFHRIGHSFVSQLVRDRILLASLDLSTVDEAGFELTKIHLILSLEY